MEINVSNLRAAYAAADESGSFNPRTHAGCDSILYTALSISALCASIREM